MADEKKTPVATSKSISPPETRDGDASARKPDAQVEEFKLDDSRKIGVTGAVFLILNKMIGTGSKLRSPF